MSLPGIRPIAVDGRGRAWCDHPVNEESSPQQHKQQPTLRLNEASPDRPSRGQTHAQHLRQNRRPANAQCTQTDDAGGEMSGGRLKRSKPVKWSVEEDRRLREAVNKFDEARWKDIASQVATRNHVQCLQRWKKVLKPGLVKGQWSSEEDDRLVRLVERGYRNWGQVASYMEGRTSKQCRERWCHHLDPAVRKGGYTPEEDDLIVLLQGEVGNRWADIAKRLTGRTENAVKIRWKALNRRQRDARNKAAAAAAAVVPGQNPMPTSTRTGGREGTKTSVRPAARTATAYEAAGSRRTTNAAKDGVRSEGVSPEEAAQGGARSPPPSPGDETRPPPPVMASSQQGGHGTSETRDERRTEITCKEEDPSRLQQHGTPRGGIEHRESCLRSLPSASKAQAGDQGTRSPLSPSEVVEEPKVEYSARPAIGPGQEDWRRAQQRAPPSRAPQAADEGLRRLCAALQNVEAMASMQESGDASPPIATRAAEAATGAPFDEASRQDPSTCCEVSPRLSQPPDYDTYEAKAWEELEVEKHHARPMRVHVAAAAAAGVRGLPPESIVPSADTGRTFWRYLPHAAAPPMVLPQYASMPPVDPYAAGAYRPLAAEPASQVICDDRARLASGVQPEPSASPLALAADVWAGSGPRVPPGGKGPAVLAAAAAVAGASSARPRAMDAGESGMWPRVSRDHGGRAEDGGRDGHDFVGGNGAPRPGLQRDGALYNSRGHGDTAIVVNEHSALVEDDPAPVVGIKHTRRKSLSTEPLAEQPAKKRKNP